MKRIALFALVALAAACSDLGIFSDPPEPIPTALSFASQLDPRDDVLERPVAMVSVDGGAVVVAGRLAEPHCSELEAVAEAGASGQVVLRVRAIPQLALCAPVAIRYMYTARIEGLPAGEYRVRVVHEFPGQDRRSEHVKTEEVEVPPTLIAT